MLDYTNAYRIFKNLPLISAIVEFALLFIWAIVDANIELTAIGRLEFGGFLLWVLIGAVSAVLTYFVLTVVLSPTVLRTDAALEVARNTVPPEEKARREAEEKARREAEEKARREAATVTHLVISRDVTVIEDYLYSRCDTFQSVTVGEWVTRVGRYAFSNCVRLRRAELKCGITHLEKGTFAGCSMLESITLPATLTVIEDRAFKGCKNLSEIRFCGTVAQWNAIEKQDSWWGGGAGCKVVCSDSAV